MMNDLGYVMIDDKNPIPHGAYIAWPGLGENNVTIQSLDNVPVGSLIKAVYTRNPILFIAGFGLGALLSLKGLAELLR